jgi:hypothetical protein
MCKKLNIYIYYNYDTNQDVYKNDNQYTMRNRHFLREEWSENVLKNE